MSLDTATISVFVSTFCLAAMLLPVPPAKAVAATVAATMRAIPTPTAPKLLTLRSPILIGLLLLPPSLGSVRSSDLGHVEVTRKTAEALAPLVGHVDDLLEPNAELARQVDAGLDAVNHPGLQLDVLAPHDPRRLV